MSLTRDLSRYKRASKTGKSWGPTDYTQVVNHYPKPTKKQRDRGYIERYFVRRYDGTTQEVSRAFYQDDFNSLPEGLFVKGKLIWFISDTAKKNGSYKTQSSKAKDKNAAAIQKLLPNFPDLNQYLSNLEEFLV